MYPADTTASDVLIELVAEAADGEEGVAQARALKPDLILADLMMPRLDGFGLCRALKADEVLSHIPIIILTAKTSQGTVIESLEHGADEYLSKPFNARELTIRIQNLIKMREQEKKLKELNEHLEVKVQELFQELVKERYAYEQQLIVAKERAEASDRVKSAILSNMSHEFRTPLSAILGFTELVSKEVGEEHQEFLGYIDQSGKRLMRTLNAVLDLATLESRVMELKRQQINVSEAVRAAVSSFQPMAREKGLTLRAEAAPEIVALADRAAVVRVLGQLIDNALKFTSEGEVVVRVAVKAGRVLLQVCDTGIGISQAFLPYLFEAFKQESEGLDREHEGSGLGLTLAHRLVQLMGGSIHAESEKGKGSTFTVTFPTTSAEVETASAAPSVSETPSAPRQDHGPQRKEHADGSGYRIRTAP
ncbi:MAG: response regulator [Bacteroidetes bacterium]|nr:response regulator [Bacteroidota bacterium]